MSSLVGAIFGALFLAAVGSLFVSHDFLTTGGIDPRTGKGKKYVDKLPGRWYLLFRKLSRTWQANSVGGLINSSSNPTR